MRLEKLKRKLLGVGDVIPDGVMLGYEITGNMLTMIGYKRLSNIETLLREIILNNTKGDVIETGVWRGGACIFMREVLNELNSDKIVYVADSFEGLPVPDEKYPYDIKDIHHSMDVLRVGLDEVKKNFELHSTTKNVIFLKGWFRDTLPKLTNKFSLIRLDGDMYESTIDALNNLYPKLVCGGFVIIDDYWAVAGCSQAVADYRKLHNIADEIVAIDGTGIYWKKSKITAASIELKYLELCNTPSDINEHLPLLRHYADKCEHVTEFGTRGGVSLYAFLSSSAVRVVAVDISPVEVPDVEKLKFVWADDLKIEIEPTDMLFIDSLHTGEHCIQELNLHAKNVKKFIFLHDTYFFGQVGEDGKKGLNYAIEEFLQNNTEWEEFYHSYDNNGLTGITRR